MSHINVLLISAQLGVQQEFASALGKHGATVILATSVDEGKSILQTHSVSVVFCADGMADDAIGVLIRPGPNADAPVVVFSEIYDQERYFNLLLAGAFDYMIYPNSTGAEQMLRRAICWNRIWEPQCASAAN